jgi:hypothetical protein
MSTVQYVRGKVDTLQVLQQLRNVITVKAQEGSFADPAKARVEYKVRIAGSETISG